MKVVIVGGVAAGLSAASQVKRQDADNEVIVLEKTGDVSYGACGMPYNLMFPDNPAEHLYALSYDTITNKRGIDYRRRNEALAVDAGRMTVRVLDAEKGSEYEESYDHLIFAAGSRARILDLPGFSNDDVFNFKNLDDLRGVKAFLAEHKPTSCLLVGAGFINLEVAEVLTELGITCTILEKAPTILPMVTSHIREKVEEKLKEKGITLHTCVNMESREGKDIITDKGRFTGDFVMVAAGAIPNRELLLEAGCDCGMNHAIRVDRYLRTTLENVYAAGDCAEHYVKPYGKNGYMPLGQTANKQGKLIGRNLTNPDNPEMFAGITQTSVFKLFDYSIAGTGLLPNQIDDLGLSWFETVVDTRTRGHYPGNGHMRIVLRTEKGTGRLLSAEMAGEDVIAKRIDVFSTAIYNNMTVDHVAELDLSYAPPFAPVWDPVLIAATQAVKDV